MGGTRNSKSGKVVPLRQAQKELTRTRIRDAAKQLFFTVGYVATTMDQIALGAGVQRSTLYAYFKDKESIVDAIAEEYGAKIESVLASLPAPSPSRRQIDRWMAQVARFAESERMPTLLFIGFGTVAEPTDGVRKLWQSVLEIMARTIPAFRASLDMSPAALPMRARAQQALRELFWACSYHIQCGNTAYAREVTRAAGDVIERFINSEAGGEAGEVPAPSSPVSPQVIDLGALRNDQPAPFPR